MAKEYIEREAALAALCRGCDKMVPSDEREPCRYRFTGCMEYYNIYELPAADEVEVVRCKDCVYHYYAVDCAGMCKLGIGSAFLDDDFCSRGTRKGGAKMEETDDG